MASLLTVYGFGLEFKGSMLQLDSLREGSTLDDKRPKLVSRLSLSSEVSFKACFDSTMGVVFAVGAKEQATERGPA
jgi:hypothetical protein